MKKKTKILIGTAAVLMVAVIAGIVTIVGNYINVSKDGTSVSIIGGADGPTSIFLAGKFSGEDKEMTYASITMDEAKKLFQTEGNYIILDVRRADEFAGGHIPLGRRKLAEIFLISKFGIENV